MPLKKRKPVVNPAPYMNKELRQAIYKKRMYHNKFIKYKSEEKKSKPKCQDKWNNVYNEEFQWQKIWNNLKRLDISNKIKEFQWKCTHNIIYTESRLRKMNLSNGR